MKVVMSGAEYLEVMRDQGYERSWLVRVLEQQVAIFQKFEQTDQAEQVKWLIFDIAEQEQKQGYFFESTECKKDN